MATARDDVDAMGEMSAAPRSKESAACGDPVLARLRAFQERTLAKRGGHLLSDSTEILREIRRQRSER